MEGNPWPRYVACVFVFLISIINCQLYKLTFSDQAEVPLQLQIREGHIFVFSCISIKILCKDLKLVCPCSGGQKHSLLSPECTLGSLQKLSC